MTSKNDRIDVVRFLHMPEVMRDLLLAIIQAEMQTASTEDYRRLYCLHEALYWRRAIDLGSNPTFWIVLNKALGSAGAAKVVKYLTGKCVH